MNLDKYADWFVDCIKCDVCKDYISEKKNGGFICNDNIHKDRIDKAEYPIRPQAGYIDEKWFEDTNAIRILLLGMNPRGGYGKKDKDNKDEDPDLYRRYDNIINSIDRGVDKRSIVCEKMYEKKGIKEQVIDYRPTSLLQEGIKEEKFAHKNVVFAYANQILCRTNPEAGKICKMPAFKDVYKNCYNRHIKQLVKTINPRFVFALGVTWENQMKKKFPELIDKTFREDIRYAPICHPSYGRHKQSLKQINEFVEKHEDGKMLNHN